MADTDRTRRFRRTRPHQSGDAAAFIDARAARNAAPQQLPAQPQPRPAAVQARQDVVDVAAFVRKVETERSQGRPAPQPQPMKTVLGAFHGSPATQTTVQILAAAATARYFGGENSAAARKWQRLVQDNAARLEAMRAAQYRQDQARCVQAQMPPEEMDRQLRARVAADREVDRRAFDAAGAVALSYVAAKALPPFDKLAELSHTHLAAPEPTPVPPEVATSLQTQTHAAQAGAVTEQADPEAEADRGIDLDKPAVPAEPQTEQDVQTDTGAVEGADVSDRLEQVQTEPTMSSEAKGGANLEQIGSALEKAGRGIGAAIGPINGNDEVAPPLSPVDLNQLSQELLDAIAAAMSSHPRSVTKMLNIERRPDHTNEIAFVPDLGVEHRQKATLTN
ncbi:hypothetical protein OCS65_28130 (plasmid) [Rhodococcus aetherivorans]|uniref:Uncharacterized protein n=1 Tax=Rhodococcus aetherivorans TaxID=191292 RepID=A0AA46Q014_9NOCA|nr:hypothetical protein [Rhodococcus aetherivorans]UYF97181.1 hypothetical protein OCS65_28130 [Rhodococcus aetherivorans]